MAVIVNTGLTLLATALQGNGTQSAVAFVGIGTGCGALSGNITSGSPVTVLNLTAGLPAALTGGQQLTVTDGTHAETVTVAAGGAVLNATAIPINSWNPLNNYTALVTGVAVTPLAADLALYNEVVRVAANAGVPGGSAGESLNSGYFDGTQPTNLYLIVGYFGGSTATAAPNTGTLIAEDIQVWNHVLNQDSASFQLDSTV